MKLYYIILYIVNADAIEIGDMMIVKFTDFNHEVMRKKSQEALKLVRALSNENRLLLLCQLSKGEMSVTELEEYLGIHQPTLSQQLGILREEGLVNTRRDGKRIFYSIDDTKALAVLSTLCTLYCQEETKNHDSC